MSLYFVAIEPDAELSAKVRAIQKDFAERFDSKKALNNFPHITIIPPFMHDEQNESEVLGHFHKTNLSSHPFEVQLNGFSCFAKKKNPVIYIKPESSIDLRSVYKEFDENMSAFKYVRVFNPHLTVAYRDLLSENFEKAWNEYQNLSFYEIFRVSEIGLYKHFCRKWNLIASKELKKS